MSESTTPQLSKEWTIHFPMKTSPCAALFPCLQVSFFRENEKGLFQRKRSRLQILSIFIWPLFLYSRLRALLLYNEYATALSHILHCPSWMINRLQKFIYICIDKRVLQFNHLIFSFVAFLKVNLLSTVFFLFFQAAPFPFKLNRTHVLM